MLRRHARERREFLYRKSLEDKYNIKKRKKELIEKSLKDNLPITGDLKQDALKIQEKLKYDVRTYDDSIDDEYKYAACDDPKIMLTTSHEPSSRLKMFMKELRLIFPNAQRINRGKYEINALVHACRANGVTDFIVVHENRGIPDNLTICHMPYGPTSFFNISGVVMRHDIPNIGFLSEQKPHLIFYNFKSQLGLRVMNILKHLFPVPKPDSKRVITFANNEDYISFRHHTYQIVNKEIEMKEVGPRFQLKLYQIKLGTLDNIKAAETEWVYRPYMNTSSKRLFLSEERGWDEEK